MDQGNFLGALQVAHKFHQELIHIVCKIPLLARRTRPVGQARRATIGYLVYNDTHCFLLDK